MNHHQEHFEKWATDNWRLCEYHFKRNPDDSSEYLEAEVQDAWDAFKAGCFFGDDLARLVMEICGNPKGVSEQQQDLLYESALQLTKKPRGEV